MPASSESGAFWQALGQAVTASTTGAAAASQNPASRPSKVRQPLPGVVYPPEAELDRYVAAGCLRHETLVDGFRQAVRKHPDNLALLGPNLRVSYAELDSITTRLAGALLAQGLAPLDRVVFQLGDSEQLIFAFLACLKAGLCTDLYDGGASRARDRLSCLAGGSKASSRARRQSEIR